MSLLGKVLGLGQDKSDERKTSGKTITDYVVFDLETTGLSKYYDEIVQIAAIRIHNGQVTGKFDRYIKPKKSIPKEATQINHITNEMVSKAKSFNEVIEEFLDFIGNSILIGYNIAGFDLCLLNNRMCMEKRSTFSARYIDVFPLARKTVDLPDYKLTSLAKHFGFETAGAHNAMADCVMTDKCFETIMKQGCMLQINQFVGKPVSFSTQPSQTSQSLNILRSIMAEIIEDGKVEERELFELKIWVNENENLRGAYPFDSISDEIDKVLEDGVVEQEELKELGAFIEEWLDPIGHARHEKIQTLKDVHIVLTGDFKYGDKNKVEEYAQKRGAIIDNSTTKKTQLVIVGALGSSAWVTGNYGNKIKKALENRAKG